MRLIEVQFRGGGSLTVTRWPNTRAASSAAGRYGPRPRLSLGLLGATLEVLSLPVGPRELGPFARCGVGRP
jgi:hypothetical protein